MATTSRTRTAALWLLATLLPSSSAAEPWRNNAEARRLVTEMNDLARRNAWAGVSQTYERAIALPGVNYDSAVHWLAAEAARNEGDMVITWRRLNRVLQIEPLHPDAIYQRAVIEASYGQVTLKARSKPDAPPALLGEDLGFNPEYRIAFTHAQEALTEAGRYEGVLPLGRYQLGEVAFEVFGGEPLLVKVRKSGKGRVATQTVSF